MDFFTAFQVFAAVVGAYSSYSSAQAQKQAADYNAQVQRNNAQIAKWQADDAYARGEKAVDDHMRKVAALKGSQTASMAARGLDLSEGTPLDILTSTDVLGEADRNTIKANAAREAWGYQVQASNSQAQAGLYQQQADNTNPLMAGTSSLLTAAAPNAEKWYKSWKAN